MDFRIGHLAYRTMDMKDTLSFYTGMLGFKHVFSIRDDKDQPWIEYVLTPDGRFIELFYPQAGEQPVPGSGYMHLCLEVDDCEAAVAELEAKGVRMTSRARRGSDGNIQAWLKDPDGRDIEVMQIVESSPQFGARRML